MVCNVYFLLNTHCFSGKNTLPFVTHPNDTLCCISLSPTFSKTFSGLRFSQLKTNMWLPHWGQLKVFVSPMGDCLDTHCALCSMTKLLFTILEKPQFLLFNTEIII